MANYKIPGEHIYENMVLIGSQTEEIINKVRDLETVDGDILIASYPKTGTTWMQEITWLVTNNVDVESAKATRLTDRMLFLENTQPHHNGQTGIDLIKSAKRPAIMKTHITGSLLQKVVDSGRAKVIVTIRNPKDTLVSMYHFYRMNSALGNFPGTWDDFFELYKTKHIIKGDYFDWYESWLVHAKKPNVRIFTYEDMKTDIFGVVERLSQFLGKVLTEEQVGSVIEHTSFSSMKSNKMVNNEQDTVLQSHISPFIRKGEIGDWKNYFSAEQSRIVDETYKEKLESKGIVLKFE